MLQLFARKNALPRTLPVLAALGDDEAVRARLEESGERDEALAVLARLAILDEDNAEAAELRAKIEAEGASDLDKIERSIIEGVAALEADKLEVVLEVDGLTKRFGGITAVEDVSFTLQAGRILGLIGPNGAGKTTIFDLLSGLLPLDNGRIHLRNWSRSAAARSSS